MDSWIERLHRAFTGSGHERWIRHIRLRTAYPARSDESLTFHKNNIIKTLLQGFKHSSTHGASFGAKQMRRLWKDVVEL
jgi:hypothetical protein